MSKKSQRGRTGLTDHKFEICISSIASQSKAGEDEAQKSNEVIRLMASAVSTVLSTKLKISALRMRELYQFDYICENTSSPA